MFGNWDTQLTFIKKIKKRKTNLYCKIAFTAVQAATLETMRMLFMQSALKIFIYTSIANITFGGLNYGYEVWG